MSALWILGSALAGTLVGSILTRLRMRKRLHPEHRLLRQSVLDHIGPMVMIAPDWSVLRTNDAFCQLLQCANLPLEQIRLPELLEQHFPGLCAQLQPQPHDVITVPDLHPQAAPERTFDLHVYPLETGKTVLHWKDTTALSLARRELLARTTALAKVGQDLQNELETARDIQSGLLPSELPRIDGIDFFVRWQPSRPVGGDLYDAVALSEDRLGIFIADVAGHGLPAAFEAALVRMSFLNRASAQLSPGQVLTAINADLRRSLASGHYVTAFYGVLHLKTLELEYARASHPRPAILRDNGDIIQLAGRGLFLGISDRVEYNDSRCQLQPGDRLCLFTDGFYEGQRKDGTRIGYAGFLDRLAASPRARLAMDLQELESELESSPPDESREDDRTFMALDIVHDHPVLRPRILARFPSALQPTIHVLHDAQEVWPLIDQMVEEMQATGWSGRDARKAQLAASELALNSVLHGLKHMPAGCSARCTWHIQADHCLFAVDDDGPGFDPDRLPDPRRPDRLGLDHGRGIFLVRRVASELWYDHSGCTATFILHPRGDNSSLQPN